MFRWVLLRVGDGLERIRPWHELPRLLGLLCLLAIRSRLRSHNLYEPTGDPDGGEAPRGLLPRTAAPERRERTADGSFTDPARRRPARPGRPSAATRRSGAAGPRRTCSTPTRAR